MTESNVKITVITVCYNAKGSIEETIKSVINQTYKNIEYIIIDGGSTDGTVDIINKYNDKVSYWISQPDKGIYDAMNKGIAAATGEYINFMNTGDRFVSNDTLSNIKFNNGDVIYGNVLKIMQKGLLRQRPNGINTLLKQMPFCHQSCFVKTELMKKNNFDIRYHIAADYNFFYNLYKENGNFCYQDIDVSMYEALSGLSSVSQIECISEYSSINGIASIKYFAWWKYNFIKLLQSMIPQKVFEKVIDIKHNFNKNYYSDKR